VPAAISQKQSATFLKNLSETLQLKQSEQTKLLSN
jgi:hypothetical protein